MLRRGIYFRRKELVHLKISSFWTLRLGLLLIIVLGLAFYLVLGRGAQVSVTEALLTQQQIIARAEVSNITSFFQRFGDSVATLAQLNSIERRDEDAALDLETFMEQRRDTGIIADVALTDKLGIVKFNSNILRTSDIGYSLADRNFFVWASSEAKKGEYYISRATVGQLEATQGQTSIVVASPVYREGEFSGVIASSVKLQPLVERFFGLMKVSDRTAVYLVDEGGDLIYGSSDADVLRDQIVSDRIEKALSSTEEGQFKTEKYLVVYSPLTLGVQKWLLIISSPAQAQEALDLTRPFYVRQTAIFIVTALIIFLLFGIIASRKKEVQKQV